MHTGQRSDKELFLCSSRPPGVPIPGDLRPSLRATTSFQSHTLRKASWPPVSSQ